MAVVQKIMAAPPEHVFAVLADGWTYSDWVVGTAHIRDVDRDWPAPGTQIHHRAVGWPLGLRDKTVVLAADPPRSLVLRPHLWPFGELIVRLKLEPLTATATRVTLDEEIASGPMRWMRNKLSDLALHGRNRESLSRLDDLATRKPQP